MKSTTIYRRKLFYILSIASFLLILILSFKVPSENLKLGQGDVFDLNNGWFVSYEDQIFEGVSLPYKFDVPKNIELLAKVVIPESFPSNFKLRLRASMQDIKIYVDNDLVFKTDKPIKTNLQTPDASVWYIVDLPSNIQNKTLSMIISSNEEAFSGTINPIYAGSGDTLLYKTIMDKKAGLIMAAVILVFGIFALIISLAVRNFLDNRIMYLGIFFILVSLWIFSETKLFQLFTGNRFIIGGISYMMLSLIPIPFVLYLRDAVLTTNEKIGTGIAIFFASNFLFNLGFQLFGIISFINSIIFTNTMMVIFLLYTIGQLFYEAIKLKNDEAKKILMYISLLVLFLLIEIYYFYIGLYEYTSVFTRIGILTFLIFIAGSTFKQLDQLILKQKEAEVMKRLAYTDILTGGYNRLAYERDLEVLISENTSQFRIVLMDINDLKLVNDRFGHSEGDRMIKNFYKIVKRIFGINAKIYRLGGDEFTVILEDIDDFSYNQKIKEVEKDLRDLSRELDYTINVAIGSDIFFNGGSQKIKDFLDHIDRLMYANKRFLKQN